MISYLGKANRRSCRNFVNNSETLENCLKVISPWLQEVRLGFLKSRLPPRDTGSWFRLSDDLDLQLYLGGAVFVFPGPMVASSLLAIFDAYRRGPDLRLHFFSAEA